MASDNPVSTLRTDIGQGVDKHRDEINAWANAVNAEIAALEAGAAAITAIDDTDSPYTVLITDRVIHADSSGGPINILLPASLGGGRVITVIRDGAGNSVTLTGNGAENIDGANTLVLTDNNTGVDVRDTGIALGDDEWDASGANVTGLAAVIAAAALNTTHRGTNGLTDHGAIGRLFSGSTLVTADLSPYTVLATDRHLIVDTQTNGPNAVILDLPASTGLGRELLITAFDASGGDIEIGPFPASGEQIDGGGADTHYIWAPANNGGTILVRDQNLAGDEWLIARPDSEDVTYQGSSYPGNESVAGALDTIGYSLVNVYTTLIPGGDGAGNVGDLDAGIEVLPALGPGLTVELVSVRTFLDWDGGAEYDEASSNVEIGWVGGAALTTPVASDSLGITALGTDLSYRHAIPVAGGVMVENTAIEIRSGTAPFAAAGTSPLSVELAFRVVRAAF